MKPESRVLPFQHTFVQKVLKDFRIKEAKKKLIAVVERETPFIGSWGRRGDQTKRVFVRFQSEAEWLNSRVSFFTRWISALRLHYISMSLLPQLLILGLAYSMEVFIPLWLIGSVFLATSSLHLSCNLLNDYEDHLRGVDYLAGTGGSGVIAKLWIPAIHIRNLSFVFLCISIFIASYIFMNLNWSSESKLVFILGVLGAIGAASYSAWPFYYKYSALGEIVFFFLCGPLMTLGLSMLFFTSETEISLFFLFCISIPLGLLAMLRIHGGNIYRIPSDIQAKVRTVASLIGFHWSKYLYGFFLFLIYLSIPLLYFYFSLSPLIFLSYLSLPVAAYQMILLAKMKSSWDPHAKKIKVSANYMDYSFGLLYVLSFFTYIISGE